MRPAPNRRPGRVRTRPPGSGGRGRRRPGRPAAAPATARGGTWLRALVSSSVFGTTEEGTWRGRPEAPPFRARGYPLEYLHKACLRDLERSPFHTATYRAGRLRLRSCGTIRGTSPTSIVTMPGRTFRRPLTTTRDGRARGRGGRLPGDPSLTCPPAAAAHRGPARRSAPADRAPPAPRRAPRGRRRTGRTAGRLRRGLGLRLRELLLTPSVPTEGDTVTVSGTVTNKGKQTVTDAHVGLRVGSRRRTPARGSTASPGTTATTSRASSTRRSVTSTPRSSPSSHRASPSPSTSRSRSTS
ncbi:hypothetical protein SGRIM128S_08117 [Streptomyces griseomycini]